MCIVCFYSSRRRPANNAAPKANDNPPNTVVPMNGFSSPVSGNALASDWAGCFWVLSVACDWVFELLSEPLEFFWTKLPFAS